MRDNLLNLLVTIPLYQIKKHPYLSFCTLSVFLTIIASLLIASSKSIWRDEAFSILASSLPTKEIIALSLRDFNPPLFHLLYSLFLKSVGIQYPLILRLFPLIFSVATLSLALWLKDYFLSKITKTKDFWLDLTYFTLVSTSTILLYFSAEIRAYSLLTFLVLLSAVFAQKLITSPQSKHIFLLSLANTALVYTHNIGLFWVFAQFLAISLVTLIQKNTPAFQKLLLASLITGILYLPWSGVTLSQTREATTNFWIENTQDKIEYEGIFTFNEVIFNENVSLKPQPYTDFIRLSKYLSILGVVVVVITFSLINPRIKTFFSFFLRFKELSHRLKFYWRDPSSIPIAAVLSLGITVFSINFFSWYITPLTYPRYFAFLNPFALLCIFFAFVFLRNFSRPILLLFLAGYLYLSGLIAHDYFKSSPVNYSIIANFSNVPIYSPEVLDIMPCVFYHPECRYVGNTKDTSRYIGVSSLPNIPSITSWHEVQEDKIIVLYKDYNHDEVLADLKAVGFEPVSSHVLGDHSILGWFVRDQKLSSGIK